MFSQNQLEEIYKLFPNKTISDNGSEIHKCQNCFVEECAIKCYCSLEVNKCDFCKYGKECKHCFENNPKMIVTKKLLMKVYDQFDIETLQKLKSIIDPDRIANDIYDKILIKVLDKPNRVAELLNAGANPDMNFGDISGNSNYTLLSWCFSIRNSYEASAKLLMKASKNGLIFTRMDCYGQNIFGALVCGMLRDTMGYEPEYKRRLELVISYGADPKLQSLNKMGISGIQYEDRPQRQKIINWLLDLGVRFDLEQCICSKYSGKCNEVTLTNTRLGRFLECRNSKQYSWFKHATRL